MTTLSDPILAGKKIPSVEFLKEYVITGGSEQVEGKLKELGWSGETPVASFGIHIDNTGNITDTQIIICGITEVGRISANTLWGIC